ncbi:hypothetical protein Tco_0405160 [Tanacetum coccineum]
MAKSSNPTQIPPQQEQNSQQEQQPKSPILFEPAPQVRYGYIKNHIKIVKNGQTRTRETEEHRSQVMQSQSRRNVIKVKACREAQGVTITIDHAAYLCVHICDPTAKANDPIIEGMDGRDCQELVTDFRPRTFLRVL